MGQGSVVAIIIIAAGLLGGLGSYLAADEGEPDKKNRLRIRYVVLGLIASAAVPLFLNLLQSDLLKMVFMNDAAIQYSFILFGFCAIAAFAARNFIDSLAARVIQQVDRNTKVAAEAKKEAEEAIEKALVAIDVAAEVAGRDEPPPPAVHAAKAAGEALVPRKDLPADEQRVLEKMMDMSFRTATGIGNDIAGLSRASAAEILNRLAGRGLVERTPAPKTGSPRWRITGAGMRTLNEA